MSEAVGTAPVTREEIHAALVGNFNMNELRAIANRIGAKGATSKEAISNNIIARANEQGLNYAGYTHGIKDAPAPAPEAVEEVTAEAEAPVEAEAVVEEKPEVELETQTLFDPYESYIKHFMFTVDGNRDEPDLDLAIYDTDTVNKEISRFLQNGFIPVEVFTAGANVNGHRIGWVLAQRNPSDPEFSEAKLVMRTLTSHPDPSRGTVTGFAADAYISNLILNEGWSMIGVRYNGDDVGLGPRSAGGVYLVWFLAR